MIPIIGIVCVVIGVLFLLWAVVVLLYPLEPYYDVTIMMLTNIDRGIASIALLFASYEFFQLAAWLKAGVLW